MPLKWLSLLLPLMAYLGIGYALWRNVGSDAGQAMPMNGVAFLAFAVVGAVALCALALAVYFA